MSDMNAFREFLVHARERTDPEAFPALRDLLSDRDPRGRRRRGVTQAHMDVLLGRTRGTYERLERGITLRTDLLESVGRALGLTEDEWRAVWTYAYSTLPPRPLNPQGRALPGQWQELLDAFETAAYIQDREGRLLAYNAEFSVYFGDEPAPDSLLRWALTSPGARKVLRNWSTEWAPALCGELRASLAANKDSKELNELMADVLADKKTAPLLKAVASTGPPASGPRPVQHPTLGRGWLIIGAAIPADYPEGRLTIATFRAGRRPVVRQPLSI